MIADEQLFREWQQGSDGSLEALIRRHHAPLLGHLMRLVGDAHAAEDLTQETLIKLVRQRDAYQYPRPFLPWLYTIARNLARNHCRRPYRQREVQRIILPDPVDTGPSPLEWLERWERREGLLHAVGALGFEQREVLSLRFGQDMSVEETAALVGVPPGTVKSRTHTALRRLREELDLQAQQLGGHARG